MNKQIKKFRMEFLVLTAVLSGCLFALAQTVLDNNSSIGNADRMRYNMNEPNAVNPARNNFQDHERKNQVIIKTEHPDKNLSNSHNSSMYEAQKKETEKK